MLFSSMTFVFLFLPIVFALYWLSRKELRNYVLLLASILFYAWGEPKYLMIMLFTVVINYFGAILIDKHQRHKKLILIGTILTDLGFLFYFKYFNFVMNNVNFIFGADIPFLEVIMPIGISFYTFQALSYVIDVYRNDAKVQRDIKKLALYICLFPQLVAGPIVKYRDVDAQIDNREERFDKIVYGVKRFIIGLAKKMLLANTMGAIVDKIFILPVTEFGALTAWVGVIAYTFQVYYDFSGYSDMAIGLGAMFGFKFLENFNYPYIAKSISEFWRRWHISLSSWFKEYLYFPLGGSRVSKARAYFNLFIVFLATGIWHGAEWTFVLWGLWHGVFIMLEKWTGFHKKEGGLALTITQHFYAMMVVLLSRVLFRADTVSYAWQYFKNMFGFIPNHNITYSLGYYVGNIEILAFIVATICSVPLFRNIASPIKNKYMHIMVNLWIVVLFFVSVAAIAASTYNPFIYFRF